MKEITIETDHAALRLTVDEDGRLWQRSFGPREEEVELRAPAYPGYGDGWIYEPALRLVHSNGDTSIDLRVESVATEGDRTEIRLKDSKHAFWSTIVFEAFPAEDVISTWVAFRHEEPGEVVLHQFASSSPAFGSGPFWLTQFHGDWSDEAHLAEEKLSFGTKILDSKLGVRAHQFRGPWFLLSKNESARDQSGEVFGGSLAWSGSFEFKFEIDPVSNLRAICGINPFASEYHLDPVIEFETPKMVWGWSNEGTGRLSRNLHRWARAHVIRDGSKDRDVVLNNWEATFFDFDEKKIVSLFDGAQELGMELFLLDDGWFGAKYPRDNDSQGLGDWDANLCKLPNGIGALTSAAKARKLRFGIWLEPEMINPKSELYEKHPEWAIHQPSREFDFQRNQLVLDLSRPEVEDFVYEVAAKTLGENPGISYIKWDCNRYITQPGSPYLPAARQSHLWVDYVRALYRVFDRIAREFPEVEIMMCSGGGGRVDYGAMRYAQEFWPSDMTDPAKRVLIQWGYSYFFPAIATAGHATTLGDRSLKFAFDVAMSGRLGMDMDLDKLSSDERAFAARAIAEYKELRETIQFGDLYRLESPYDGSRSALLLSADDSAVLFVYSLGESKSGPVLLNGIETESSYAVREINLEKGEVEMEKCFDGQYLLQQGLHIPPLGFCESAVFRLDKISTNENQ